MMKLLLLITLLFSFNTYSVELNLSDDCVSSLKSWNNISNKKNKRRGLNKVLLKKSCSGIESVFKVPDNSSFSTFLYKMSSYNFYSKNEDLYLKFHTAMEKKVEEIVEASDNKKTIEQSNIIGQVWNKIVLDTEVEKQNFDFLGATCNDDKGSSNSALGYLQGFFKDADEQIGKDLWKSTAKGTKECLVTWCNCLDKSNNRVYGAISYPKCKSSLMSAGGKCSSKSWAFDSKSSKKKNLPKFDRICKSTNAVSYAVTTDSEVLHLRRSNPDSVKVGIDPSLFAKWAKDNL